MNNDKRASAGSDGEYAWFRDGSVPHSREDRIAEALAMIALLPVSAKAESPATETLELSAFQAVPATPGRPERFVAATEPQAGDPLE